MTALIRKVYRDLLIMRTQSLTIALVIACGIALLVSSWSAYHSLKNAREGFYRDYRFADMFVEMKRAPETLLLKVSKLPGVTAVDARITGDVLLQMPEMDEPANGRILSIRPNDKNALNQVYLREGRLPGDGSDLEVVVNEGFAVAHKLKNGSYFKATINGQIRDLRVVGVVLSPEFVYALNPARPLPDDRHFGIIWMHENNLRTLLDMSGSFNNLSLALEPQAKRQEIKFELDQIFKAYGSAGAYEQKDNLSDGFVADEIAQQKASAYFMPTIFLSVAAFLLNVIFSRLVALQRGQIATLKACGYSNFELAIHYLEIILLIVLIGCAIGLVAGVGLGMYNTEMYRRFFRFPKFDFFPDFLAMAIGIGAGVLAAIAGTFTAIRSVVTMAPAEAMRPITPPNFKESLLERTGLMRMMNIPWRMAVRNQQVRPFRLLMAVIGIGLGIAISVMTNFWLDTINLVIETQFYQSDRSDITVYFSKPQTLTGLEELRHLPGVTDVEGYRSIGVRLHFHNHFDDIAIQGFPDSPRLRALVDLDLNNVKLPETNFLMSLGLAKKWGVRPGDVLRAELLDGTNREWPIEISALSDDLVGRGVFTRIENLWQLLGESASYSTANLLVDSRRAGELYVELKNHPMIYGVNSKTILIKSFRDTMAKVVLVFTYILIGFGVLIAIGVMYNTSRVAFSERAWELASLRILGFSRAQVMWQFASELAIQVLFALPLGCAIGYFFAYLSGMTVHTETFVFPLIVTGRNYVISMLVILGAFAGSVLVIRKLLNTLDLSEALKARD